MKPISLGDALGMLDRYVNEVEAMRKIHKRYLKSDGDQDVLRQLMAQQKKVDDMIFEYRKWTRKRSHKL